MWQRCIPPPCHRCLLTATQPSTTLHPQIPPQVSFLATMVGPKIASAAAQRALEVLAEEDAAAAAEVAQELAAAQAGGGDAAMPDVGKNGQQTDGVSSDRWETHLMQQGDTSCLCGGAEGILLLLRHQFRHAALVCWPTLLAPSRPTRSPSLRHARGLRQPLAWLQRQSRPSC